MSDNSPRIRAKRAHLELVSPAPIHPPSPIVVPALQDQVDTYFDISSQENRLVTSTPAIVSAIQKPAGQAYVSSFITQASQPSNVPFAGQLYPETSNRVQVANRLPQGESVALNVMNAPGLGTSISNALNTEQDMSSPNKHGPNPKVPITRSHVDGIACGNNSDQSILPTSLVPSSSPSSNHTPQIYRGILDELQTIAGRTTCHDLSTQAHQSVNHCLYPNDGSQPSDATYNPSSGNALPQNIMLPPKPPNSATPHSKWCHLTNTFAPTSSPRHDNPTTISLLQHATPAIRHNLQSEEAVYAPSKLHDGENDGENNTLQQERKRLSDSKRKRFPAGSRVFIGNLSKSVKRKDLYELFSRYGAVEEISLKNESYGFAQYLTAAEADAAINHLQGIKVCGQKINLEIAHEQTKNSERNRGGRGKRDSDRNRGRRDDRRLGRRPSSRHSNHDRNNRGRNHRENSYSSDRRRSQSPRLNGHDPYTFRQRSTSPFPQRLHRETIPDVHLLLDNVSHGFITWVHHELAKHRLVVDSSALDSRISRDEVVKRLVVEGVKAVAMLDYAAEERGLISMDLFDRQEGTSNVRHDQYLDLLPDQIAQIVLRQHQAQQAQRPSYSNQYASAGYAPTYVPSFPASNQTYPPAAMPDMINRIGDPGMIQNLLATLGSNPQSFATHFPPNPPPNMVPSGVPYAGNPHPQLQNVLEHLAWPQ